MLFLIPLSLRGILVFLMLCAAVVHPYVIGAGFALYFACRIGRWCWRMERRQRVEDSIRRG
jgi:hypothetical protein